MNINEVLNQYKNYVIARIPRCKCVRQMFLYDKTYLLVDDH